MSHNSPVLLSESMMKQKQIRVLLQLGMLALVTCETLRGIRTRTIGTHNIYSNGNSGERILESELAGCEKVDVVDIVCHFAMLMEACAFMQKDINKLRWLILISQVGSAVYTILDTSYNWFDCNFIWAILHSSINASMLFYAWKERVLLRNSMSDEERNLWEQHFSIFNLNEFKVIKDQWKRVHQDEGQVIIGMGEEVTHVALVVEGKCSIVDKEIEIEQIGEGMFLGEVSFFSNSKAATTIKSCSPNGTDLIMWPKALMQKGMAKRGSGHIASAYQKFPALFTTQMAKHTDLLIGMTSASRYTNLLIFMPICLQIYFI